jgi:hypothetical protein
MGMRNGNVGDTGAACVGRATSPVGDAPPFGRARFAITLISYDTNGAQ